MEILKFFAKYENFWYNISIIKNIKVLIKYIKNFLIIKGEKRLWQRCLKIQEKYLII